MVFLKNDLLTLCALVSCLHVCLCEDVGYSRTGVTDSCEPPCGCWNLNPGPLEEQPMLLLELSLQPRNVLNKNCSMKMLRIRVIIATTTIMVVSWN